MGQQQKRIGLIGLSAKGSWASNAHLDYLRNSPHYTITALQNSTKASASAAAEQYSLGSITTYEDPQSLATDPNVDIVAVSVNVPQHYSLVKPALEAGKDVFVEWPMAANVTEAEEFHNLATSKGLRTLVGLQARQNPTILKAKEIVESGKLGKILGTVFHGYGAIGGPSIPEAYEYSLDIESGANLMTIPFGHNIDAVCFVVGEVRELSARLGKNYPDVTVLNKDGTEKYTKPRTAHDYISFTGTLVSGGIITASYVGGLPDTKREVYWEISGTEGTLVLEAEKNMGYFQIFQPSLKFYRKGNDVVEEIEVERYQGPGFNVGRAWDAWAGVGLEKGTGLVTFEDGLKRHRMIEAIYRSAANGTRESYW